MPEKRRSEKSYYEPVRQFLESEMGCITESIKRSGKTRKFIGRGFGGLIIDVFGLRGTKERDSRNLEGIAVEVKRSRSRTSLRNLVQASQYGRLAHRCYLAQPRRFDKRTVIEASRIGIGLMEISGGGIRVRTESRAFNPDTETFEVFLNRSLEIVRCSLCGCHLCRYKKGEPHINAKGHFVLDEFSPNSQQGKLNKKMYLCSKCDEIVAGIAGGNSLRKSVNKLERKMRWISRKLKAKK
jgi:hypothetical protein